MPTNLDTLLDIAARDTAPRPKATDKKDAHRRNSAAFDRTVDDIRKQDAYKQDRLDEQHRKDTSKSPNANHNSTRNTASDTPPSDTTTSADKTTTDTSSLETTTPAVGVQGDKQPPVSEETGRQTARTDFTPTTQTNTPHAEATSAAASESDATATTTNTTDATKLADTDQPAQTPATTTKQPAHALPEQASAQPSGLRPDTATPPANTDTAQSSQPGILTADKQPVGNAPVGSTAQTVSALMEKTGGAVDGAIHAHNANTHTAKQAGGPNTNPETETTPLATSSVTDTVPDASPSDGKTNATTDQSNAQTPLTNAAPDGTAVPANGTDAANAADGTAPRPQSPDQHAAAQTAQQQNAQTAAPAQTPDEAQQASTAQTVSGQNEDARKAEIKSGAPAHTLSGQTANDKTAPTPNAANAGPNSGATTGGDASPGSQASGTQTQNPTQQPQALSADGQNTPQSTDAPSRLAELITARHAPEQTGKPVDVQAPPVLDDTMDAPSAAKIDAVATAKSAPAHGLRLSNAQAHQVQSQVAVHIASQVKSGASKFEIRLDPPELGRIEVQLDIAKDGKVKAMLSADQQDTLDLLQRDQKFLQKALSDAGLDLDNDGLTFSLNDQAQHGHQQTNEHANNQAGAHSTLTVNATDTDIPDLTEYRVTESYGIRLTHRLGVNIAV